MTPDRISDATVAASWKKLWGYGFICFSIVGILLSLLIASWVRKKEVELTQKEFSRRLQLRQHFFRERLADYEKTLLALRLMYLTSRDVRADEFQLASSDLFARTPGLRALQWAAWTDVSGLPQLLVALRNTHGSNFSPKERLPEDGYKPLDGSSRPEYAVLSFTHPYQGNEVALGYDLFTAPTAPYLLRARKTGEITLTPFYHTAQGTWAVNLIAYVDRPVYSDTPPPDTGPGFLQAVIDLEPMFERLALAGISSLLADFAFFDVTDENKPIALFSYIAEKRNLLPRLTPEEFNGSSTILHDIIIGGRHWRAAYRPAEAWIQSKRSRLPELMVVAGTLLSLLAGATTHSIRRRQAQIRTQVEIRTRQLNDQIKLIADILEFSPSAVWLKNAKGIYQIVNREFCLCHNKQPTEILGRSDAVLFPPEKYAELRESDQRVLREGLPHYFEDAHPVRGERRLFFVCKFPVRRSDGTFYAVGGFATDITQRRRAETERQTIERRLFETQRLESLGVLAGGIAHDFNNLLTGILGYTGLVRLQLGASHPANQSLTQIEQAGRRAADLCRQMLSYAGRNPSDAKPLCLETLIREVVPLLKLSTSHQARLHLNFPQSLPPILADESQISQIVMNLVINAAESLHETGGDITLTLRKVSADTALFQTCIYAPILPSGDYILLEVEDNGCGIDATNLPRIFEPFFTTKFAGRGLGLSAMLGIVRARHGAVRVFSRKGHGTRFEIYLPAAVPERASTQARNARQKTIKPKPPPSRFLLIDDDPDVIASIPSLLRSVGHTVEIATNSDSALHRLKNTEGPILDALIVDLSLPLIGGGGRMLDLLRSQFPDLPVLIVSGYDKTMAATYLKDGRRTFLAKPFDADALIATIDKLLPTNRC